MITTPIRAAIYVGTSFCTPQHAQACIELSLETCERYCALQGYQLSKHHIYVGGQEPFWSDTPLLTHLRLAAFQGQFDVLVITSLAGIGYIPPWHTHPSLRTINGVSIPPSYSLRLAETIHRFYQQHVPIHSVIKRYGTNDAYRQMLFEGLQFVHHRKRR